MAHTQRSGHRRRRRMSRRERWLAQLLPWFLTVIVCAGVPITIAILYSFIRDDPELESRLLVSECVVGIVLLTGLALAGLGYVLDSLARRLRQATGSAERRAREAMRRSPMYDSEIDVGVEVG